MDPLTIIRQATRSVPAVRYALGISGLVAAVALAKALVQDYRVGAIGAVGMLILGTSLVIFAHLARLRSNFLAPPAIVLTWFSLSLFIATASTLFFCVFFRWPLDLQHWLLAYDRSSWPLSLPPPSPQRFGSLRERGYEHLVADQPSRHELDVLDEWVILVREGSESQMLRVWEDFRELYIVAGDEIWLNDIFLVRNPDQHGSWMVVIDAFSGQSTEATVRSELNRLKRLKSSGAANVELPLSDARVIFYSQERFAETYLH